MQKHYIIGDIHGEYEMLMALVAKLPKDARLIFVGDIVAGKESVVDLISFVRANAFVMVRGNHEEYMLEHGRRFLEILEQKSSYEAWRYISGIAMLTPYRPLFRDNLNAFSFIRNQEGIERLEEDLLYIESLPFYYELKGVEGYGKPIVISHGSIGDYWRLKESNIEEFKFFCTNGSIAPSKDIPIFNIYGHIHHPSVKIAEHFVSLDTGCGRKNRSKKLSAYCVETREVFEVKKNE